MKQIETLVDDIESLLVNGKDFTDAEFEKLGSMIAQSIKGSFERVREPTLRMSNIGQPCERKLWYSINQPEKAEGLSASTYLKFMYGHILESLLLFLAEAAGHDVKGTQDTQEIEGVKGHRDAVIDGVVIDSKSASSFSFKKFKDHELEGNDSFGYIDQLGSYLEAGQNDPIVIDKDRAAFLVIDKQHGHICLDIHKKREMDYQALFRYKKSVVNSPEVPERDFKDVPDGASGNRKLGTICSYCDHKNHCWPGLRTFLYSGSPRFLTTVKLLPKVPEINGPVDPDA